MDTDQRRTLEALYRETDYRLDGLPAPLVLAVDIASAKLAALMSVRGCRCAAFITACNPRGEALAEAGNAERMLQLCQWLGDAGFEWLPAEGRARDGSHAERSLLVFGLSLKSAQALMHRFEQNAFLWMDASAVPRLIWTAGLPPLPQ